MKTSNNVKVSKPSKPAKFKKELAPGTAQSEQEKRLAAQKVTAKDIDGGMFTNCARENEKAANEEKELTELERLKQHCEQVDNFNKQSRINGGIFVPRRA
jgi:hypothetical protein